ncbi:hypothetical protein RNJ44_03000 [Nakaseomyces bracarensis]|uniref:Antisense of depressing factor protein 1 n=1 Tax=Nakaseomyces bracarensis TaxID=273131 RepID=A0ABR4NYI7_9SACH
MSKKQSTKKTGKSFSSRGKTDSKGKVNAKATHQNGKISASQRKKTKMQVAKINAGVNDFNVIQELGHMDPEPTQREEDKKALNIEKLIEDEKRDKKVREQIESEQKETNNDMLKQLELMSGFSL